MKHFYQNIDGFSAYRDQGKLLEFILTKININNKINIAEIGVYKGRCTAMWNVILLEAGINYDYHAIDNFLGSREHDKNIDYYQMACDNLAPIWDKIRLIKNDSVLQSDKYQNDYFDIVYIDGSHDYEDANADIVSWLPKVKRTGFLCGDDFIHPWVGVKRAVRENFGKSIGRIGRQQWYSVKS